MAYYSHHVQKRSAETPAKPADPSYVRADPGGWTAKDLYGTVNPFESGWGNNLLYGGGGALLGYGLGALLDRLRGRRRGEAGLGGIGALAGLGLGLGGRYFVNSRLGDEAQYFNNPEQYGLMIDKLNKVDAQRYGEPVSHLMIAGSNAGRALNRSAWDSVFGSEMPKLDPRLSGANAPMYWPEARPEFGEEK